ncbi:hypothetical protein F2Q70_00022420 [Brassica cretica]|uniref:Uncharacterized protein n=1 Tax=Brassica cretica TaxID=69181 RepID=A0A8S9GMN8_BRACR|nr:hypothetical protein F2Q70_00022420 [Brassica cretica]KAF3611786.1 hypothetical protein DY000_02048911 [Brassica cretica]
MVESGLFALLKVECNKIRAAPCEGCLLTPVEGIKAFVVHPGVEILTTCFPVRPLRDVRDQCDGFRARPGLITALGGAMTTLTYVSHIVFDLIPSRCKVRDMFSVYVTCMVGIKHLFEDNF